MTREQLDAALNALELDLTENYGFPEPNAKRLAAVLVEWSLPQYGDIE